MPTSGDSASDPGPSSSAGISSRRTWRGERKRARRGRRLAKLEPHPALAPLLRRIAQQEARHIAFSTTQATNRLAESALARRFTRFALSKVWGPSGSTIEPEEEVRFVMGSLFDGPDGLREVRKMDEAVAKPPGMQGLAVNERAFRARGLSASA